MTNVLLIAPTSVGYGRANQRRVYLYPPTGLCYIAAVLRENGHRVEILDLSLIDPPSRGARLEAQLRTRGVTVVGVTATTPQIDEATALLAQVKAMVPDCLTIVGGPHASAMPEHVLGTGHVDIVVRGEGEATIVELLANPDALEAVRGISYRRGAEMIHNAPRPHRKNLDALPFPALDLLEGDRYGDVFLGRALGIMGSRGCPNACSFCSKEVFGRRVRLRSPENIVAELQHWREQLGVSAFFFQDEVFTINAARTAALCRQLIDSGLEWRWSCTTSPRLLNRPLMRLMRDAGCQNLGIGVESADETVRAACHKKDSMADIRRAVRWANEFGLPCLGTFILGLPQETRSSFMRTIAFMREVDFDFISIAVLVPLPKTEVWDLVERGEQLKWKNRDFSAFGKYSAPVIELPTLTAEELEALLRLAYRRFYLRPKDLLKRLKNVTPLGLTKDAGAFFRLLPFMFELDGIWDRPFQTTFWPRCRQLFSAARAWMRGGS